jgi:hypothetical protein
MLCIIGNLGDCAGTRVAVAEEDRLGGPAATFRSTGVQNSGIGKSARLRPLTGYVWRRRAQIPALAAGSRRAAIITARSRLVGAYLNEVRYLAQLNLHMQSTKAGSVQARARDGQLVLRFPDRVTGWISHRWQLSYNDGRDAVA